MCKRETFSLIPSHTHSYTRFLHKQALSSAEPFCTPVSSRAHLARPAGFHTRREFLASPGSQAWESKREFKEPRRRAGRAWARRKELEFPLFLNEGENLPGDPPPRPQRKPLFCEVGLCPSPHIPAGEGVGDAAQTSGKLGRSKD